MIRRIFLLSAAVALATALSFGQDDKKSVKITGYLIDNQCAASNNTEAEAKNHATSCALMPSCEKAGYSVVAGDKTFTLDENGNKLAEAVLRSTSSKKGVKVEVEGTVDNTTLKADKLTEVKAAS